MRVPLFLPLSLFLLGQGAAEARAGTMQDLGTLGGTYSSARGVGESGAVFGESTTAGDAETHAFLYAGGIMTDLGTLGGTFSTARGMNAAGVVFGDSTTAADPDFTHAFIYEDGVM